MVLLLRVLYEIKLEKMIIEPRLRNPWEIIETGLEGLFVHTEYNIWKIGGQCNCGR